MHGSSHLLCVIAGSMGLAALGSGATRADTINISIWAHGAPLQEAVIATQPDLLKLIPGEVKWLPISSGPAALAGMKGGAYNIVNGVGNPPVTTAIANGVGCLGAILRQRRHCHRCLARGPRGHGR